MKVDPKRVDIFQISSFNFENLQAIKGQVKPKECMENAILIANTYEADFIEGILKCTHSDGTGFFIAHAWNIKDGKHFDITKDFILDDLDVQFTSEYFMRAQFSPKEYELDENKLYSWKSDVFEVAKDYNLRLHENNNFKKLH